MQDLNDFLRCSGFRRRHGFGRHRSGEWVSDETILRLLGQIGFVDVLDCKIDAVTKRVYTGDAHLESQRALALVTHVAEEDRATHFSCIFVDLEKMAAHVFDTFQPWKSREAKRVVRSLLPSLPGLTVYDHTGRIRQTGATCGPWSLWILVACAFDFLGVVDGLSRGEYGALRQSDAMSFWKRWTK